MDMSQCSWRRFCLLASISDVVYRFAVVSAHLYNFIFKICSGLCTDRLARFCGGGGGWHSNQWRGWVLIYAVIRVFQNSWIMHIDHFDRWFPLELYRWGRGESHKWVVVDCLTYLWKKLLGNSFSKKEVCQKDVSQNIDNCIARVWN